jgi:hypothetical protein
MAFTLVSNSFKEGCGGGNKSPASYICPRKGSGSADAG